VLNRIGDFNSFMKFPFAAGMGALRGVAGGAWRAKSARCVRSALTLLLVAVVLVAGLPVVGGSVASGQTKNPEEDFRFTVADWNRTLEAARTYLDRPDKTPTRTDEIRLALEEVVVDAVAKLDGLRADLRTQERRQEALGPAPGDGETEGLELSEERQRIADRLSELRGRIAQAELARLTAQEIDRALSETARARIVERIQTRGPLPFDPTVLGRAAVQAYGVADALVAAPVAWYSALPSMDRDLRDILAPLIFVPVALFLTIVVRRVLLRRFGRSHVETTPSYTRRIVAAFAEGIANGLVPASVFLVVLLRVESDQSLVSGLFGVVLSAAMEQAIVFVLIVALAQAALSPRHPEWRLTSLVPENAAVLAARIGVMAAILAVVGFLDAINAYLDPGRELETVVGFASIVSLSAMIFLIGRPRLWTRTDTPLPNADEEADDRDDDGPDSGFWDVVRKIVVVLPLLASLAAAVGFVAFGNYVVPNLIDSIFIAAGAYLIRDLLRELVGFGMRSMLIRDRMAVPYEARKRVKFWIRAVIDPAILIAAVILILPTWGVPWIEVTSIARDALFGFEIGQIRISIIDILAAILVFAIALGVTRLIQRTLRDRVLPQTRLDTGVRHSVTAGIGYVGAILGGLMAVTVVGVDLSNIALIAGALSVGIGFGLQNIVNNFVSGLILLIERPIKVGDWVNVNGNEGFVKQINVRATELETFQKASVIIPNADLLSTAVTNWTHKDRYGRIEVAVGVAYGSDTRKVERILLETAREHPLVAKSPEPFVVFIDFGASSLDFEVRCYTGDVIMKLMIASDIRHEIDRKFRLEGIEIPFPQRVLHMAQEPTVSEIKGKRRPGQGQPEVEGEDGPD